MVIGSIMVNGNGTYVWCMVCVVSTMYINTRHHRVADRQDRKIVKVVCRDSQIQFKDRIEQKPLILRYEGSA